MIKDIIIFVNAIRPLTFEALREYESRSDRKFKPVILVDEKVKELIFTCNGQYNLPEKVTVVTADFNSADSVRSALKEYENRIFAVTSQYENCIQELRQLIPYLPYLPVPTEKSLVWATEKKLMRQMLGSYDSSLIPRYMEVLGVDQEVIEEIEVTLSYPLVVKPSGLEGSLLVSYVKDRQQLEDTLRSIFLLIQGSYDTWVKRQQPVVLVEEFMVGDMYTIDVYVNSRGECSFTPIISTLVARKVGYDDLFPYKEFLPSGLNSVEEGRGRLAAREACHALGLRSVTAHVEMMRTAEGWKIIELGPRIGGWRYELLKEAYGINHIVNDIQNRADEEPEVPMILQKYVDDFNLYAHSEGVLEAVHGLEEVKNLPSFHYMRQNIFVGQQASFAKNGGDVIVHIILSNSSKAQLEADSAIMEAIVKFDIQNNEN